MGLTNIQKEVLQLTSCSLAENITCIDVNDWEALKDESYDQAVYLLVYSVIYSYLPASEQEAWLEISEKVAAKNMTVDYEHTELHELMTQNQIPYTIIKGSSAAAYYPDPLKRMMGDVDFLISEKDMDKVGKVLESNGFVRTVDLEHEFHVAYHRDNISTWEVHFRVGGIPDNEKGELIRIYLSDIIEKAVLYNHNGRVFRMPCPFHHGLIILIHTAEHLTTTGIGLRHLCDWAVFANNMPDEEFISLFEEKLKTVGLWKFACIITHLSEKYLNIRHCTWLDQSLNLPDEFFENLIGDIFKGGNFGNKDRQRLNQAKLITDSNTQGAGKHGALLQIALSINAKARERVPIIRKAPILMPLGWVYTTFWYIGLLIQGKRPSINIKQMIKGAQERREIYKEFKLFEVEK